MTIYEAMIYCIKNEISTSCVKFNLHLSELEVEQLYKISQQHDLSHIVGNALIKNKVLQYNTELYSLFQNKIVLALYRYEKSNYEFNEIAKLFEKKQIEFIPLKGLILRELYPEQWMRTSCDIDILIKKEDINKATQCFLDAGLKKGVESPHDITFITKSGIHIELHHSLIENKGLSNIDFLLNEVWKKSTLHKGCLYWRDMNDQMFYFYHIAHMAKHFLFGGCGVKPFMDLFILDNLNDIDYNKRNELLKRGNLFKFANAARKLTRIWFENEEYDSISKQMEYYIMQGGVYGNTENYISIQQQKNGGKIKYTLSKFFLSYNEIKFHYPILQKHRWLTPIMEIRRWGKLVFCGHLKRTIKEIRYNNNITNEEAVNTQNFMNSIGLLDLEKN